MQRKQLKRSSNLIQRPKYEPRATTAEAKPARSMKATTVDELPAGDNYKLLKAKTTWSLSNKINGGDKATNPDSQQKLQW